MLVDWTFPPLARFQRVFNWKYLYPLEIKPKALRVPARALGTGPEETPLGRAQDAPQARPILH